jgi:hypothetical protein
MNRRFTFPPSVALTKGFSPHTRQIPLLAARICIFLTARLCTSFTDPAVCGMLAA